MHRATHVIGRAVALHAPGTYTSSVNERSVDAWVLELEGGHCLLVSDPADPTSTQFLELDVRTVRFYQLACQSFANCALELSRLAAALGLDPVLGPELLRGALVHATRVFAASRHNSG